MIERLPRPAPSLDPMKRMRDELFGPRGPASALFAPSMDVLERNDEIVVRASLPGVKKEDIEISVSGTLLTIRGEAKPSKKQEESEYYRTEIPHGAFSRTLALPAEVDESKAKATLSEGVLELTLPKPHKAMGRRIRID
jgi:HSP20 family protein